MNFDFISEGLARELVSGSQLIQCWQVAALLQRLLQQREETIDTLSEAADSLNGHYRRAAIAKSVGSFAGTGGKVATGIGAAALAWAPITGGLSLIATAGCTIAGGATWAAGSLVTLGTFAVENRLCSKIITRANDAIARDQTYAGQLREAWSGLECMLESVYNQFQDVLNIRNILNLVWNVFQRTQAFVTSESVDWTGIVSTATNTAREAIRNTYTMAVRVIKTIITEAIRVSEMMDIHVFGLRIPGNLPTMMLGVGAVLVGLDVAVLFNNVVKLAINEEHPGAIRIRSTMATLQNERDRLQSFSGALHRRLATIDNAVA